MKRNIILIATTAIAMVLGSQLTNLPGDDLARVSANGGTPSTFVEPQSQCDFCKPRVSAPTVHYLRHNGSQHEVGVEFTYSLPPCGNPNLTIVFLELNFPKGIARVQAGVNVRSCGGTPGTCKTFVRVAGLASDGRPTSYLVNVEASTTLTLSENAIGHTSTPF